MNVFSNIARFFHWLIAGLIISQYVLAKLSENAQANDRILEQLALLANHKSIGMTILALAVLRLLYRLTYPPLKIPASMPLWQHHASNASHFLLYLFLFAMPLSGWLMSSAKAYSVSWFNLFTLPDVIAPSESLATTLHSIHHLLAEALFVVTVIHVAAALKHHFIDKDKVLTSMAGWKSWVFLVLVLFVSISVFGRLFDRDLVQSVSQNTIEGPVSSTSTVDQEKSSSNLPVWKINHKESYIKFTGDQAGAPFTGIWKQWTADIQFDANELANSRFNVIVDLTSGFSNDKERDETIQSADFFDVAAFAQAHYTASKFGVDGAGFKGQGKLTMKGFTSQAPLSFTISYERGKTVLSGTAKLDRLVWNIGSGEWADTTWVGQQVEVEVRVVTQ